MCHPRWLGIIFGTEWPSPRFVRIKIWTKKILGLERVDPVQGVSGAVFFPGERQSWVLLRATSNANRNIFGVVDLEYYIMYVYI